MEKENLSKKLNYLLKELNMNKTQFIEACKSVNPSISKPTVLNVINGNTKGFPKLETIDTIIKVCQNSKNDNLKNISYDFLMNEYINNINNENISINDKTGLSDKAIDILYLNHYKEQYVLSYLIENIHHNFWQYQEFLKSISELQALFLKLDNLHNKEFKADMLNNINNLYYSFKKEQLYILKKRKSKKDYKEYILEKLNCSNIFNAKQSTEELEECLLNFYKASTGDLKQIFYKYLKSETSVGNYNKSDLKNFKKYYIEHNEYEENSYLDKYIDIIEQISNYYISVFSREYLRENFKTQYVFLKDRKKYYSEINFYRNQGIKMDYDFYIDFHNEMKKIVNSLEVLNKYLRLSISEYMSEYYNNMIAISN